MSTDDPTAALVATAVQALRLRVRALRQPATGHSAVVRFVELDDGRDAVLKVPSSSAKAKREIDALAALAGHAPVPRVLAHATWPGGDALLLERLPGAPLGPDALDADALTRIGHALARVHTAPLDDRTETRATWRELFDPALTQLAACRAELEHPRWLRVEEVLAALRVRPPGLARPVRAHFDPLPANYLFDDGRVTGVIDFESSRGAPPEVDLALLANEVGADGLDDVLTGYATVRPAPPGCARSLPILQMCGAVAAVAFCVRKGRTGGTFVEQRLGVIDDCLDRIAGS